MSILSNQTNTNPRKVLKLSGSSYITSSKNDTYGVTHAIPQSDYQYTWVTASAIEDRRVFLNNGYATSSDWLQGNQVLSGTRIFESINTDTNGLPKSIRKVSNNLRLLDIGEESAPMGEFGPYTSFDQFVGYRGFDTLISDYRVYPRDLEEINADELNAPDSLPLMNSLYLYGLAGPRGFSSIEQTRLGQHPVNRFLRKSGRVDIARGPREIRVNLGSTSQQVQEKRTSNVVFSESCIDPGSLPVRHVLDEIDVFSGKVTTVGYKYSFQNNLTYFANEQLNSFLGLENDSLQYIDNFKSLYIGSENTDSDLIQAFKSLTISQYIYPKKENVYLRKIRDRSVITSSWKNERAARTFNNFVNSQGKTISTASIWQLDARENFQTDPMYGTGSARPLGNTGELQSDGVQFHNGDITNLTSSALYALRVAVREPEGVFYEGESKFEAAAQAGSSPFDDSYEKYANDLLAVAKEYSLVPEFRVSEHIDYYINDAGGNFLADRDGLFTVEGASISSSSEQEFFNVFNSSDIINGFDDLKKEHEIIGRPSEIEFEIDAMMHFTPYQGFYPMERSVELASLFSQSYGPGAFLSGVSDPDNTYPSVPKQGIYRTLATPFISPGILYNSIKSGIACSFTAATGSDKPLVVTTGEGDAPRQIFSSLAGVQYSTLKKLPFESITAPETYVQSTLKDLEPHVQSGSVLSAASFGSYKNNFKLAVSNYLAEVPGFFLKNKAMKSLLSAEDTDPDYYVMQLNKEYRMRLYLRTAENYDDYSIFKDMSNTDGATANGIDGGSDNLFFRAAQASIQTSSVIFSNPTISLYDRPGFDNNAFFSVVFPTTEYSASYQHGGSAFGYPIFSSYYQFLVNGAGAQFTVQPFGGTFEAYTPPYYEGYSYVDFIFRPFDESGNYVNSTRSRRFTLDQIFSRLTSSYYRYSNNPVISYFFKDARLQGLNVNTDVIEITGSNVYASGDPSLGNVDYFGKEEVETMHINDSITVQGLIKNRNVEFREDGTPVVIKEDSTAGSRWAVYPKWETPIYDFTNVSYEVPQTGSWSVGRGQWHQFGDDIIDDSKGLFLQISDAPANYIRYNQVNNKVEVSGSDATLTGSLADVCGFNKNPVRLGETSEKRTVQEAVVMVPFYENNGVRTFVKIDEDNLRGALEGTGSAPIRKQIEKMRKYVIPPRFDFLTYDGNNGRERVDPVSMYIFEFSYDFNKNDLKRIWHNTAPSKKVINKKVKIKHRFVDGELLEGITQDNLKWMIFKVKQKGEWNYFRKTLDTRDDQRFQFKFKANDILESPDYSYNWPYDFMSLVEGVKIKTSIKIENFEDADSGDEPLLNKSVNFDASSAIKSSSPNNSITGITSFDNPLGGGE